MAKKIIILFCLFFVSCGKPVYKNSFVVANTYLEVLSPYKNAGKVVYDEFRRLEGIFNIYNENSEIYKLNRTHNKTFYASRDLVGIILAAKEINSLTDGYFDISCGVIYNFWKKLIKETKVVSFPDDDVIKNKINSCGMNDINLEGNTIIIKREGIKLDLGGIAKGYMVDQAVAKLKENGIDKALINAGGDIYCLGSFKDKPWIVAIKSPDKRHQVAEEHEMANKAIATSGNYEQFFTYKNNRYSHLVDPKTGYPVKNNILSVSVVSESCAFSDALATAFFVMGLDKTKQFIENSTVSIKAIVIVSEEDGQQVYTFEQ